MTHTLSAAENARLAVLEAHPTMTAEAKAKAKAGLLIAFHNRKRKADEEASRGSLTLAQRSEPQTAPSRSGPRTTIDVELDLSARDRFDVVAHFNQDLITLVKELSTRQYHADRRQWSIELKEYDLFLKKLRSSPDLDAKIVDLPTWVKSVFKAGFSGAMPSRSVSGQSLEGVDASLRGILYPYQADGVRFGLSRFGKLLLADDMGLGKTFQALAIASVYRSRGEGPTLIVCPANVKSVWLDKCSNSLDSVESDNVYELVSGATGLPPVKDKKAILICSYDMVDKFTTGKGKRTFATVILDESHSVKDEQTKRYRSCRIICQETIESAAHRILLTGTPALSRPIELWTQLNLICPNLFPGQEGRRKFAFRYCDGQDRRLKNGVTILEARGCERQNELQIFMEEACMIRRMKADVLKKDVGQLPTKTRHRVVLDKDTVRTNLAALKKAAEAMNNADGKHYQDALLIYFHETAIAKEDAICKYVAGVLRQSPDQKVLVFAHHTSVIDKLASACLCRELGFSPDQSIIITGAVSSAKRGALVERFQTDPDVRVALLSIKAANAGITLTAGTLVIFSELFWNPGELLQAEDRTHRIGQTRPVEVRYLVAKGTADDYLWPLVEKKMSVLGSIGLNTATFKDAGVSVVTDSPADVVRHAARTAPNQPSIEKFLSDYKPPDEDAESIDDLRPSKFPKKEY